MTGIPGFENEVASRPWPVLLPQLSPTVFGTGRVLDLLRRAADVRREVGPWFRERRAGIAGSLALHVLLLGGALLVFASGPPIQAPPPESMSVEVVTPTEFATFAAPKIPARSPTSPAVLIPRAPASLPPALPKAPGSAAPVLAHAATILSNGALDGVARASLRRLDGDARFEQLCNVEAMEQIARSDPGHVPERAIAYAMADTRKEGDTLIAEGGAFLSKGHWYHLAFRCSGTPDRRQIIAFDFATGAQFPDDDPALPSGGDD